MRPTGSFLQRDRIPPLFDKGNLDAVAGFLVRPGEILKVLSENF
jgi:hypothetical protein